MRLEYIADTQRFDEQEKLIGAQLRPSTPVYQVDRNKRDLQLRNIEKNKRRCSISTVGPGLRTLRDEVGILISLKLFNLVLRFK